MHEATIAQSILNIASSTLQRNPSTDAVVRIQVVVGQFRNVDIESLQFAFDQLKEFQTGCGGCKLEAETIQARAVCAPAGHTYSPVLDNEFKCDICGGGIGKLLSGEELDVIGVTLLSKKEGAFENARISG